MAEKIEIDITARDLASSALTGIQGIFRDMGLNADKVALAFGAVTLAGAAIGTLKQFTEETLKYNKEVAEMVRLTGETPQEMSKLVLLLETFGLTTADAQLASRKFSEQGLVLTIDSLKKLSEQYQAIENPAERQRFLYENLGRAGQEWSEVLSLTPGKIDGMVAALNPALLLTDQNLKATDENALAVARWNQEWQAFVITTGNGIIPALTDILGFLMEIDPWMKRLNPTLALLNGIGKFSDTARGEASPQNPNWMGAAAEQFLLPTGVGGRPPDERGPGGITVIVPFNYSPALGTASRADIEQLAPVIGELVGRELRNRHITGGT